MPSPKLKLKLKKVSRFLTTKKPLRDFKPVQQPLLTAGSTTVASS